MEERTAHHVGHRTMQDYIDAAGGLAQLVWGDDSLVRRLVRQDDAARQRFACACGRLVDTENMLDLAPDHVPAPHRLTASHRAAIGSTHRFACDGCWTLWVRTGRLDKHVLRRATGQSPLSGEKVW